VSIFLLTAASCKPCVQGRLSPCCPYDLSGRLDCVLSYLRPVGSSGQVGSRGLFSSAHAHTLLKKKFHLLTE
jgi:hypothetical protein